MCIVDCVRAAASIYEKNGICCVCKRERIFFILIRSRKKKKAFRRNICVHGMRKRRKVDERKKGLKERIENEIENEKKSKGFGMETAGLMLWNEFLFHGFKKKYFK
jgi:hypothetical protein